MTLEQEALRWAEDQRHEFMHVYTVLSLADPNNDPCEENENDPKSVGWYARLSAPGYMDCTDWVGPCESETEAIVDLYTIYGE